MAETRRLRPAALARYIARSASWTSSARVQADDGDFDAVAIVRLSNQPKQALYQRLGLSNGVRKSTAERHA
jgi:hypothetical protein